MKTKLLFAGLLTASCSIAAAQSIDVTNHPDRAFFDGYERLYKRLDDGSVCVASHAQFRSGHEQIGLNDICKGLGITEEKIKSDLMKAMKYVKGHSSADSFSEFFQMSRVGNYYFTDEPQDFCIFRNSITYIFTNVKSPNNKDWRIISTSHNRPGSGSPFYGLWKVDQNGDVIAKIGLNKIQPETLKIDMSKTSDCRTTKPYVRGPLLPSN